MKTNTKAKKVSLKGAIVILGWNDVVANSKNLGKVLAGKFRKGGPSIPIEFSRISTGGHLTPVIDVNAPPTPTMFAIAKSKNLKTVAMEVAKREGITKNMDRVGFLSIKDMTVNNRSLAKYPAICNTIGDWAMKHKVAGVVWQSLGRKFKNKLNVPFNNQNALNYLNGLNPRNRARSIRYMKACPVTTPFKTFLENEVL